MYSLPPPPNIMTTFTHIRACVEIKTPFFSDSLISFYHMTNLHITQENKNHSFRCFLIPNLFLLYLKLLLIDVPPRNLTWSILVPPTMVFLLNCIWILILWLVNYLLWSHCRFIFWYEPTYTWHLHLRIWTIKMKF